MVATIETVLPLESGDRLTREEFHRRYCAHPEIKRAELVQGVVYVSSPVRYKVHDEQHGLITVWLGTYALGTPGVRFTNQATYYLSADDEVQPDGSLFRDPAPRGGARVRPDLYIEGPPQLVVEVAASSVNYDLHDKKESYRRAGVHEYIVWRTLDGALDWFRLVDGEYVPVTPDAAGGITSDQFSGLRLAVGKLLTGDGAGVLAELDAAMQAVRGE